MEGCNAFRNFEAFIIDIKRKNRDMFWKIKKTSGTKEGDKIV
ncbi:hypothetical protein RUMHYD_02643 [Blautia hydrogenotrophica DSM 10507]|uniref:Uncharacterized protein n=1 Tax=Blautia hydrogenotrophica (strain DSM 10507 / JCM 14656 / S5a33) TaxID=476272 RepID=C0CP42_BLAHS|nr:hypothetical protein RUMHYD_02643 [Blautia hydrogenotrophica DSM 10507]